MGLPLLKDIVIIFSLAVAVTYLCHRIRIPGLVGFLITGALAGPHGFGLVHAAHEVEVMAEIGVVLLLFAIGLEFSLKDLWRMKRIVLAGGAAQVVLTVCAGALAAMALGWKPGPGLFLGFLVSLSSTAIVLKLLQEKAQVESPHGRISLGILIFQDIAVVGMVLAVPFLAGGGGAPVSGELIKLAKGLVLVVILFLAGPRLIPKALYLIARTRSRETFLLAIIVICFAIAFLTEKAGLSLALGAFLAGLFLSEGEYGHQAAGSILPFHDVFASLFFISIGMLLDVHFLLARPWAIAGLTLGVILVKPALAAVGGLIAGYPVRTAAQAGVNLGQVGEFSFVLSLAGLQAGLISRDFYQLFIACSVITMVLTPALMALAPRVAEAAARLPLPQRMRLPGPPGGEAHKPLSDHLVIVGYGTIGRNMARAARWAEIPYVVVEFNSETVRREQIAGVPIQYGDASQEAVLHRAGTRSARAAVVAINDPAAARRITQAVRRENPGAYIIVRTRFLTDMKDLYALGADEVIPEEFETSVEIFSRVLARYLVPDDDIREMVGRIRSDAYQMFRSINETASIANSLGPHSPDLRVSAVRIKEGAPLAGHTIAENELRKRHGVTVAAIRRGTQTMVNPSPETLIQPGDILYVLGSPEKVARFGGSLCQGDTVCEAGFS